MRIGMILDHIYPTDRVKNEAESLIESGLRSIYFVCLLKILLRMK